jgi:hypothetical protein
MMMMMMMMMPKELDKIKSSMIKGTGRILRMEKYMPNFGKKSQGK